MGDATYSELERLYAHGLIDSLMLGQRPLTRLDVARMVIEATQEIGGHRSENLTFTPSLLGSIRWLSDEYAEEIEALKSNGSSLNAVRSTPLATVTETASGLTSAGRIVTSNNGLGITTAQVNPLVANRSSRTIAEDAQMVIETAHHAQLSKFVVVDVRPRIALRAMRDRTGAYNPTINTATAKLGVENLELMVGRGQVVWGPGENGALLLSSNAPTMNMVRFGTPSPFRLPWVFRHIGNIKVSTLFADMGTDYNPAHTILSGLRLDVQPQPWITIGINHAVMMGGKGMADPTPGDAALEFFGINGFIQGPGHGSASTNHIVGIDLLIKIPQWRGMQFYGAYAYDDPDKNLEIQFDQEAMWMGGFYLPRLSNNGTWSLRAEYMRAGAGVYRHTPYVGGWAVGGQSLGLPYGGNSNAGILTIEYLAPFGVHGRGKVGAVQRSGDIYSMVFTNGDRSGIEKITDFPDEFSAHILLDARIPIKRGVELSLAGGYEHVWNANFVGGDHRNNFLAEAGISINIPRLRRQQRLQTPSFAQIPASE